MFWRRGTQYFMQQVRLEEYQFTFHKVIEDEGCRNELRKYLKRESCDELLTFYEEYLQLDKLCGHVQVVEHVHQMYNLYIQRGGEMELNISATMADDIHHSLHLFTTTTTTNSAQQQLSPRTNRNNGSRNSSGISIMNLIGCTSPYSVDFLQYSSSSTTNGNNTEAKRIYGDCVICVLKDIKNNGFIRFVRQEQWLSYVRRRYATREQLEEIAVHMSQVEQMLLSAEDVERPYITGYDLTCAISMNRDSILWELISFSNSSHGIVTSVMVFRGKLQILTDAAERILGPMSLFKMVFNMNCSAQDAFLVGNSLEYHNVVWDNHIMPIDSRNLPADNTACTRAQDVKFDSFLYYLDMDTKVPFALKRSLYSSTTGVHLPSSDDYIVIGKPTNQRNIYADGDSRTKRVNMSAFTWNMYKHIREGQMRLTAINMLNAGGFLTPSKEESKVSRWVLNQTFRRIAKKSAKGFNHAVTEFVQSDRPKLTDLAKYIELSSVNKANVELFTQLTPSTRSQQTTSILVNES